LPSEALIVALDCGTSSTKAIAVDRAGSIRARVAAPLELRTPDSGWVEHTVEDVLGSVDAALGDLLELIDSKDVAAVGLSNQRESVAIWDKESGTPLSPVLSWQDRRASSIARSMYDAGHSDTVRGISGLPLDPMFSAVKATWLLDTYDPKRTKALAGELTLGTVDTLIVRHLTGCDVTEPGNASRTSLLDLSTAQWSQTLLDIFGVPRECMAGIEPSARNSRLIKRGPLTGRPLCGVVGDSHAALFAHRGWRNGLAKATLGTGSSVMAIVESDVDHPGLCKTIGWQLPGCEPALALEANILAAGATLSWLASILDTTADELAQQASRATDTVIVPAFNGLGAPWWDQGARAIIDGLSLSTTRGDLARAALDSVAWQLSDVIEALIESRVPLDSLVLDGSMTNNASLVRDIANASRTSVCVADDPDASARGAADMAALGAGLSTLDELEGRTGDYRTVPPEVDDAEHEKQRNRWRQALVKARESKRSA